MRGSSSGRQGADLNTRASLQLLTLFPRVLCDVLSLSAWTEAIVPNFVTSNAYLAHCYARNQLCFIRDWLLRHPGANREQPVYIVELGAGAFWSTGRCVCVFGVSGAAPALYCCLCLCLCMCVCVCVCVCVRVCVCVSVCVST